MAIHRDEGQFNHIPIAKEPNIEPQRRGRQAPRVGLSRPENRTQHAQTINAQIHDSLAEIQSNRTRSGVDPQRLLVLEFDNLGFELDEAFAERFGAQIVDERQNAGAESAKKRYTAVLQFDSLAAIQRFQTEIRAYSQEARGSLPRAQRRDFLDSLQRVRGLTPEDRTGNRLRTDGVPASSTFPVDVDLWHPGENNRAREVVDQVRVLCHESGMRVLDDLRSSSLLLLKVLANPEGLKLLLNLDLVARVDLPPRVSIAFSNLSQDISWPNPTTVPDESDPLACVIDSGVLSGHPLLANWVIEVQDFDSGEDTPVDLNGHGTAVAGLVVYGDVAACLEANQWQPKVRICSAKILRNQPNPSQPDRPEAVFPENGLKRVEKVVEEAIRHFHGRGCRVFNLSVGDCDKVYNDQRQFSWAEALDTLARELDIVVVVSTGNFNPAIPDAPATRDRFRKAVRDQTLQHRLIDPATAALAISVGSIARADGLPERNVSMTAAAPSGGISPFSRTGPGYALRPTSKGVKPDLVDCGGNYALRAMTPDTRCWAEPPALLEPSLRRDYIDRSVQMFAGTSYAAPHVTHAAAIAQVALRESLGHEPSANLIRALVGGSATVPAAPHGWYSDAKARCSLIGYGQPQIHRLPWSHQNDSRLVAMDELEENKFHIYRIPIPDDFRAAEGRRGMTIALAYDPPVRGSRKEYMARTMFFEPLVGLTISQAEEMLAKFDGARGEEPKLPADKRLVMEPGKLRVAYSTLQVRRIEWQTRDALIRLADDNGENALTIAVFCQKRFSMNPVEVRQGYGLVVEFWHQSAEVRLYDALRNSVRQRVRQQVRLPG